ncbi:hypothetical protein, partial [Xylanibacter rodentium]
MKKSLLTTAMMLFSTAIFAQYINEAPVGGFNVNKGKDYVVLYAPDHVITDMGSRLISNNNLDATQTDNVLEYWVTDWDKKDLTLYNVPEPDGKNSFGTSGYINATPFWEWGTGVFIPKAKMYDLSKITDKHHLHIGMRDFGSASSQYKFTIGSQKTIKTNGFQIEVNLDYAKADGDFVGVGKIAGGNDGKWYYLDIPVSDLVDENGDFGFVYDFSAPITDGVFTFSFNKPVCSTAKKSGPAPGETVYTYEITKLGSALSLDHVFFYIPDETSAINDVNIDSGNDEIKVVYDLSGRRVDMNRPGIYMIKTAAGVKKVVV